jgi:hypothetical protein
MRRVVHVRGRHTRVGSRVCHHGPNVCIMHEQHVHDRGKPTILHGVDGLQRRYIREPRGNGFERPSLYGVPQRLVYKRLEPIRLYDPYGLRGRHTTDCGGHIDEPAVVHGLRGRLLLPGRWDSATRMQWRDVGSRWERRHRLRSLDHL